MRTHFLIALFALMVTACASRENIEVSQTPSEQTDTSEYVFLDQGQAARAR